MQEVWIVSGQVMVMFMIMALGWFLGKTGSIRKDAIRSMNLLVMYIANPCIMIQSFNRPFSMEMMENLGVAFMLSIGVMVIAIFFACLFYTRKQTMFRYAVIFNNCGFIGIPLVSAVLGEEAIFYLTILMAVWNVLAWTYGCGLLEKSARSYQEALAVKSSSSMNSQTDTLRVRKPAAGKKADREFLRRILLNPAMISCAIGLVLFFFSIPLPSVFDQTLGYLGGMNTPLAMIVLGYSLAQIHPSAMLRQKGLGMLAFLRLIVVPLATFALFSLVPERYNLIRCTMLIAASTPVGAMLTMFLHKFHGDTARGSILVTFTTLCSIVTIPLVLIPMSLVWM